MHNVYGLSALMEAVAHVDEETEALEAIDINLMPLAETFTYLDAAEAGFLGGDDENVETSMDDYADDEGIDDDDDVQTLDGVLTTLVDDEDDDLDALDDALESLVVDEEFDNYTFV